VGLVLVSNAKETTIMHWWEVPATEQAAEAAQPKAVAYYRHSAQDRQENSIPIQQDQVRQWAEKNGVDIIQEFADAGKSGQTAEGQPMPKNICSRAIGYARTAVSNPENIARQVTEIREYCDRHAIMLVKIVTVCGSSGNKPFDERGGRLIKEMVLRGAVDTLIVTDAARLSRDPDVLATTADWLNEHDVGIYLLSNGSYYFPVL